MEGRTDGPRGDDITISCRQWWASHQCLRRAACPAEAVISTGATGPRSAAPGRHRHVDAHRHRVGTSAGTGLASTRDLETVDDDAHAVAVDDRNLRRQTLVVGHDQRQSISVHSRCRRAVVLPVPLGTLHYVKPEVNKFRGH